MRRLYLEAIRLRSPSYPQGLRLCGPRKVGKTAIVAQLAEEGMACMLQAQGEDKDSHYRVHPLSVAELCSTHVLSAEINPFPKKIDDARFEALFRFSGFPEPYLQENARFWKRWRAFSQKQLLEDILKQTRIHELDQIETLTKLLQQQVAILTSHSVLAKQAGVSPDTIKRWIEILQSFYFCFSLKPYAHHVPRSLLQEPKYFLWDWSGIVDKDARNKNFVASHLLKAIHFWTDQGLGIFELYFLRDKEKREVDFLVMKNKKPWFIVDVKVSSDMPLSAHLAYFQQQTGAEHAFQVSMDMPFEEGNCFEHTAPVIVPAKTFLAQLI